MKKPNESFPVIRDLLSCLVDYSEYLTEPPSDSKIIPMHEREAKRETFIIRSPRDRLDALIILLFGEEKEEKSRGNRSFLEHDKRLMRELLKEQKKNPAPFSKLIDKYVPLAQKRKRDTDDTSIIARLNQAYRFLIYEEKFLQKFSDFSKSEYQHAVASEHENNIRYEINILDFWLSKYRSQLINHLDP